MKASLRTKLQHLSERLEEINHLLASPDVISDQNKFRTLSQEHAQLGPIVSCHNDYEETLTAIDDAKVMLEEDDPEMREMAQEELKSAEKRQEVLAQELQLLMLPKDPNDDRSSRRHWR
mgnify:CR=1 FL=1